MASITHESLAIDGVIGMEKLLDLEILVEPNKHAAAYLKGELDENTGMREIENLEEHKMLTIKSSAENNQGVLFKGYIRKAGVKKEGKYYIVEIEALSSTILLDEKRKRRAFQDKNLTYGELVDKVIDADSKKNIVPYKDEKAKNKKILAPLIEYDETDWEFLLRIASHLNLVLIPDEKAEKPAFSFGIKTLETEQQESKDENKELTAVFFEKPFLRGMLIENYFKKAITMKDIKASSFRYYDVISNNDYNIGMNTIVDDNLLTICGKRGKLVKDEIIYTYRLGRKEALGSLIYYNSNLQGRILEGTVLSTRKELVKINLDIDDKSSSGKEYEYEWVPETGNVMYCMPEKGTRIALYIGGADEREAWAIHSIRTNGEKCKDTQDYKKRYFTTNSKKRCFLKEEEMGFSIEAKDDGKIKFALQDKEGIHFKSSKNIQLYADENIIMNGKRMTGSAKIHIAMQQKKKGFNLGTSINMIGNKSRINTRIPIYIQNQWTDIQKKLQDMKPEELKNLNEDGLVKLLLRSGKADLYKWCNADQIAGIMSNINNGSLSPKSKVQLNAQIFTKALEDGVKSDQMVVQSPKYIKEDGEIDWPKEDGYVLRKDGTADKKQVYPQKGDIIDCYGSEYEKYVSPVTKDGRYDYASRSLPYIENENAYHQYEVIKDFSNLKETIENCEDVQLIEKLKKDAKEYHYDIANFETYQGKIAKAFDKPGGGERITLPISIEYLKDFGFIREI